MVVLGASANPERYSYKAVRRLVSNRYDVVAIGKQKGFIGKIPVITEQVPLSNVHTVLIYVAPINQSSIVDYVLSLRPKRVIFNPGTESPEFEDLLESYDVKVVHECSLVMIAMGRF